MAAIGQDALLGMANRFVVTVMPSNRSLGTWGKASGLEVKLGRARVPVGRGLELPWSFPGIAKYQTIKLERAAVAKDTKEVKKWLEETSTAYVTHQVTIGCTTPTASSP